MTAKLAFSRREACDTLSIGPTKLHELINAGSHSKPSKSAARHLLRVTHSGD